MDSSVLFCRFCGNAFDGEGHSPLMIPSCGHTICRECLAGRLGGGDWDCAEGGCRIEGGIELESFPSNHALLKLIGAKSVTPRGLDKDAGDPFGEAEDAAELCGIHGNKLTIVCVSPCQRKVCFECGLFGEHKVILAEPHHDL